MASTKKAIIFRISNDTEIKLAKIEAHLKEKKIFETKNIMYDYIIDVAYRTITEDGTSSMMQTRSNEELEKNITEKIENGFNSLAAKMNDNGKQNELDTYALLLEMFEDIELILKLVPYADNYRNEDKSEKTAEILKLVEGKSMFRKYTHKKVEKILEKQNKGE